MVFMSTAREWNSSILRTDYYQEGSMQGETVRRHMSR